jgi:hypothetical protein
MVFNKQFIIVGGLALAFLGGCTGAEGPDSSSRSGEGEGVTPEAAAEEVAPTDEATADNWQSWVASENARIQKADPAFHDAVLHLETKQTRARFGRLVDPMLHNPDAAPVLIQRLQNGSDDSETRAAIAEALPRTQGQYAPAAAAMISTEADPKVRVALVDTLKKADAAHAILGLKAGFADSDIEVRRAAARIAGARVDGSELSAELLVALDDGDNELRGIAARSLGVLSVEEAKAPLAELVQDSDAEVRLHSLRALSRIDPAYAAALPGVDSMQQDSDQRVANVATKIVASR